MKIDKIVERDVEVTITLNANQIRVLRYLVGNASASYCAKACGISENIPEDLFRDIDKLHQGLKSIIQQSKISYEPI